MRAARTGYLGIDLGGTKVALRVEGDDGSAHETSFRWPSPGDAERDVAALAQSVRTLRRRRVRAVGVAVPATFDETGRVTVWPGRPAWEGVELGAILRSMFPGTPVRWADDGDLAAVAEARSVNCEDLVYLGVGTGVGGGIVREGRSFPSRGSCEIGHMVVDLSGPRCDCGRRGCLQAVASGPATLRRAARRIGRDVTFAELTGALAARSEWAQAAVEETCVALAASAISLQELVRPSLISIGGGFATGLPGFVSMVSRHTRRLARPGHPPAPVEGATLRALSSLHGALVLARESAIAAPDAR